MVETGFNITNRAGSQSVNVTTRQMDFEKERSTSLTIADTEFGAIFDPASNSLSVDMNSNITNYSTDLSSNIGVLYVDSSEEDREGVNIHGREEGSDFIFANLGDGPVGDGNERNVFTKDGHQDVVFYTGEGFDNMDDPESRDENDIFIPVDDPAQLEIMANETWNHFNISPLSEDAILNEGPILGDPGTRTIYSQGEDVPVNEQTTISFPDGNAQGEPVQYRANWANEAQYFNGSTSDGTPIQDLVMAIADGTTSRVFLEGLDPDADQHIDLQNGAPNEIDIFSQLPENELREMLTLDSNDSLNIHPDLEPFGNAIFRDHSTSVYNELIRPRLEQ